MIRLHSKVSRHAVLLALLATVMIVWTGCASNQAAGVKTGTNEDLAAKRITGISVTEAAENVSVEIAGSSLLTYTSVKQPFPLAVILYFPETALEGVQSTIAADSDTVSSISSAEVNTSSRTARIEIALKKDTAYEVTRQGNGLNVAFKKAPSTVSAPTVPAETVEAAPQPADTSAPKPLLLAAAPTTSAQSQPKSDYVGPAWVNRIDFSGEDAGKSTLIVGTTIPIEYKMTKVGNRLLQLELQNTNIPDYRRRPLITTRFESAVDRILPIQKPEFKNFSIMSIELREAVPYYVEQTDNLLMVHFEASSVPPKKLDEAQLPPWRQVIQQAAPGTTEAVSPAVSGAPAKTTVTAATASTMPVGAPSMIGAPRKVFTGEKIALDFYETDIKNVFRILREVSGKNFAIDKNVTGKVTMTLDKPVPWDQVLDLVLRMNQLGMVYEGEIIRVATVKTLQEEEDLRAAQKEAAKKNREQEKALEPLVTAYIPVNYSNAQTEILPHINNILTKERGSATVDGRNNQLIVTDVAEKVRQAREIVQRIDKVTPQVIIEARVVEVNSEFTKELGINWSAGNDILGAAGTVSGSLGGTYGYDFAMNYPAATANSSIGFNFSRLVGTPFVLNARLNAMERTGDGKIISSPKIVTLDNKKARIKQGIEYPYLERDDAGGSSVKFKNIDLLLEVTPHVTPDSRIALNILITKNDVKSLVAGVPSLATNEAETELLVNDGDTIVIGGIIKKKQTTGEEAFPGLSRVPVLGWLFKNNIDEKENNELLIFITPRIVQLEQRSLES